MTRRLAGELVEVGDHAVHVRRDGPPDAPAVVLVHGFSASMHGWDRLVPLLATDHHVVRLDLAGHGGTPVRAMDAPDQARLVAGLLESLDLKQVTMVGHSFGCDVAVAATERSDRVTRLALLAQSPDYSDARLPHGSVLMTLPLVGAALHRNAPTGAVHRGGAWGFAPGFRPGRHHAEQAIADHAAMDPAMYAVVLGARRRRLAKRPLDVQVADLGLPTLVVLGGRDRFYGDRAAERYRAAGAHVEVLPDSGHSPQVERPGRTAQLLRAHVGTVG